MYVEGRIQTEKWEDKSGAARVSNKVVANVIQFIGRAPTSTGELETQVSQVVETDAEFI